MADTLLGGIVINEILVDPNGAINFDTDGNGTAASVDEYVELFNASSTAIDISGLEFWDQGVGQWFTFPMGTILQPGAHAMVMSGVQSGGSLPTGGPNDLFFDAGRGSPFINNGGDNVTLFDPAADEFIQATYNGDALDDPTLYTGFSATATRNGVGEDFGNDTDGQSLQRTGDGADVFSSDAPTPGTTNICFVKGSRLATVDGEKPVENLRVGDLVLTADSGAKPISWILTRTWSQAQVAQFPNLSAVCIKHGALGEGLPNNDLLLSQQHRVLVRGPIAQRMFEGFEVLVPAKLLLALDGVELVQPKGGITYYHIMLEQHQILFSEGVPTESLFLGKQAMESIPASALQEIELILGVSVSDLSDTTGPKTPVRTLVNGKLGKQLIARHLKNQRPICAVAFKSACNAGEHAQ